MRISLIALIVVLARVGLGQVIDFETFPDGSLTGAGTRISNQFSTNFGVSFRFEDGSFPVIRKVGGTNANGKPTAFWGWPNNSTYNTPAPGQDIGTYFLTDNAGVGSAPAPLVISYSQPVASASGFIIDVDHEEAWDVQALSSSTQLLAQVRLQAGDPLTGDGIAAPWAFQRPTADLALIRVLFAGNTNDAIGLAFDNFSPATRRPQPVPAAVQLKHFSNTASLTITGTVSAVYRVDEATSLTTRNWTNFTSIVLPSSPFTLTNLPATNGMQRFYRVVGME